MTALEDIAEGDTIFFKMNDRVFSGPVFYIGPDYIQARTPAAAKICKHWYSLCFYTRGNKAGQAMASPGAELIVPQTFDELASLQEQAEKNNAQAQSDVAIERQKSFCR